MASKGISAISIESLSLFDRLVKVAVGQVISYEELSTICGRNVQKEGYGSLHTAARKALNEKRMVFESVRGVGIKRLNDVEIVGTAKPAIARIRRAVRRAAKKLVCIEDFNKLPNAEKLEHNTQLSHLGVLKQMMQPKAVQAIQTKVQMTQARLPVQSAIDAMRE